MKIGIIVRRLSNFGGVQRQALSVADGLSKNGHDVTLYTFSYDRDRCYPELVNGIPVISLPERDHLSTSGFFGFINETRMAKRLSKLIKDDTEILHPHCIISHHVAYFYKKNHRNIPSVWNMNELPSMRWPLEMLSVVENPAYHDIPNRPLWYKKAVILLKNTYDSFFVLRQDVVTVFDTFHKKMLKRYAKVDSVIVPSGLDVNRFQYKEHSIKDRDELNLFTSGIFLSYRRFEDIFEAMHILIEEGKKVKLEIFGEYATDQKYFEKLKDLSVQLGIEKFIHYKGSYQDNELLETFEESHIFIFPHLQSQGLSVYESIAAGLPTIVAPVDGTYETLVDREHVMRVPIKSPEKIADAIIELSKDNDLYDRLSKGGSDFVRNNFSWLRYAGAMEDILKKELEKSKIKTA